MARSKNNSETAERSLLQFEDRDSRLTFIQERLDNLLDEFGQSYGRFLAEELQKRLDHTVRVFHEETSELMDRMVRQSEARMEMSDALRQGKTVRDLVPGAVSASPRAGTPAAGAPQRAGVSEAAGSSGDKVVGTDRVSTPKSLFKVKKEF